MDIIWHLIFGFARDEDVPHSPRVALRPSSDPVWRRSHTGKRVAGLDPDKMDTEMESGLVLFGAALALYALAASRLDRWSIGAPIVLVAVGFALGPQGFNVLAVSIGTFPLRLLAELTLALLLFTDASTVDLRSAERDARLPGRLLLIGLPLTIALGAVVARFVLPGEGWAPAALLAAILAPTDAALSLQVVTNKVVPARTRRALNIESGLNDGIATPFVAFFLAAVLATESSQTHHWLREALAQLGIGVVVAVGIGVVAGAAVNRARRHGWTTPTSEQLFVLALALLAYGTSLVAGGNGFVAAFVAGIVFGSTTKGALRQPTEFAETIGMFLSFAVWGLFGLILVGPAVSGGVSFAPIVYAVFSLTLIRMVPVAASLLGSGLRRDSVAFIGWFGPRGLASVVFALLAYDALSSAGLPVSTLQLTATWTILLSVLLHGLSAGPLAEVYGRRLRSAVPPPMELEGPSAVRVRRRGLT